MGIYKVYIMRSQACIVESIIDSTSKINAFMERTKTGLDLTVESAMANANDADGLVRKFGELRKQGVEALQQAKVPLRKRLVFLWTSDEEIGSESSRQIFEAEAKRSDAVFVLEPSLVPRGMVKTSRKGVGEAKLIVHGRSAHAGLDPDRGINAIHELAAQIARIEKWNDPRHGVTVNADLIDGGTRTNVIPDSATVNFDLRAWRHTDMRALEKRFRALKPIRRGVNLEVRG